MNTTGRSLESNCRTSADCRPVGRSAGISVVVALGVLGMPAAARAATADQICSQVAQQATRVGWDLLDDAGDEAFCRKPWVRVVDRLNACDGRMFRVYGGKLKNLWNRFVTGADASWATWGPRGVGPEIETGTIVGGFKRTFFGAGIAEGTSTVRVTKTGGQARAEITVCRIARDGTVETADRRTYASGTGRVGSTETLTYQNTSNVLVGIVVDTPVSLNSFSYSVQLTSQPTISETAPVAGIADLHNHQYANLAFGGRFYWGDSLEPIATGLASEVINGDTTLQSLAPLDFANRLGQLIVGGLAGVSIDANLILPVIDPGLPLAADGFFTVGTAGFPTFSSWPHHADRTHQQGHISWVQAAHNYGTMSAIAAPTPALRPDRSQLNLLVVTAVNNDTLCKVLKTFDKLGNAPTRDAQGNITSWRSANWECWDEDNVVRQLQAIHQAEQTYPWYRVAMNPWHARRIIREGDLAVIVSMETDKPLSGPNGNMGDWRAQLDTYRAMGLTTLQIVHEQNSIFAGAAPHRDFLMALQAIQWPVASIGNFIDNIVNGQGISPFDLDNDGFNERGLTNVGGELVDAMVARNMPIDLAHASLRARRAVMGRVPDGYGLFDSHVKFERLLRPSPGQTNYGTSSLDREKKFMLQDQIIGEYVSDQVLVGLRTTAIDVYDAPNSQVVNDCPGSAKSFAQVVQFAHEQGLCIAYGTDINTGVAQLGPRFGTGACWAANGALVQDPTARPTPQLGPGATQPALPAWSTGVPTIDGTRYYEDGLATIAWLPELTRDLVGMGTPGAAEKLQASAEAYVAMWERAYSHADSESGAANLGVGASCTRSGDCASGLCREGQCRCAQNSHCGATRYCEADVDLSNNTCRTKRPDGEACPLINGGDRCISGFCSAGRCYTPNSKVIGDRCYVGAECREGRCNNVTDGLRGTCVCTQDSECATRQYCDAGLDFTTNTCRAKKADGSTCDLVGGGHQCLSGRCAYSRCYTPDSKNIGQSCYIGSECRVGRCNHVANGVRGTCVCTSDSHCSSTQYCDAGLDFKANACRAKKSDGSSCALVNGGRTCRSGLCSYGRCYTRNAKSLGQSCYVDAECRVGKCSNPQGVRGVCVCKNHSDCRSGYWCDAGLDLTQNTCKRKLNKGEVCGVIGEIGVGHRCKSGKCKVSGLKLKCK